MDASVIIPARNAGRTIGECLEALSRQTRKPLEVIVVDDGSTDDTVEIARRAGARVASFPPSGIAAARNRGVEASRGEIMLFTDADCAPDPNWVEEMLLPFQDPDVIAVKGIYRTAQTQITARFVQLEYESRYRRMAGVRSLDFIDTYSAAYRRSLFIQTGGFNEDFIIGEDQEFSFRFSKLKGRLVFNPRAVVRHYHADHPIRYCRKKFRIGYWKANVIGRHPDKIASDSHTTLSLKLELVSMVCLLASLPLSFEPWGLIAASASGGLFAGCALAFFLWAVQKDPPLAMWSPLFLLLRALSLSAGFILGLGTLPFRRFAQKPGSSSCWIRTSEAQKPIPAVEVEEKANEFA